MRCLLAPAAANHTSQVPAMRGCRTRRGRQCELHLHPMQRPAARARLDRCMGRIQRKPRTCSSRAQVRASRLSCRAAGGITRRNLCFPRGVVRRRCAGPDARPEAGEPRLQPGRASREAVRATEWRQFGATCPRQEDGTAAAIDPSAQRAACECAGRVLGASPGQRNIGAADRRHMHDRRDASRVRNGTSPCRCIAGVGSGSRTNDVSCWRAGKERNVPKYVHLAV